MPTRIEDAGSLGGLWRRAVSEWPDRPAYLVSEGQGYRPITYSEADAKVYAYARALDHYALKPGDRVALVCETCLDWALIDWACQTLGLVLVPVFPTLPADQVSYIVKDSGARLVLAQDKKQAAKVDPEPPLGIVSLADGGFPSDGGLSREGWHRVTAELRPEDIATIIYTSGTTGQPKGAVLANAGFIQVCSSIRNHWPVDENDVWLSFLPLSHVFERVAGHVLPVACGASIAYARSIASLASDMAAVRPTIACAVPRFYESMRTRILESAQKMSGLQRFMFEGALDQARAKSRGKFAPFYPVLDRLVGSKIRARFGGRFKFFVSGGAALSPQVNDFFSGFNICILQGYGLTETTAATCLNHPDRNRSDTVGEPIPGVEVKIASDGEILIRGTTVMKGYYQLPSETALAIDTEGWFHSGDIGEFSGSHLKITDRKKDILVLANGKNVAPQRVEAQLKESEFIQEVVLFGDGLEHCIALIVPNFERLKTELLNKTGSLEDLVESEEAQQIFRHEVALANKQLADYERVKRYRILTKEFSIEDGELTPSLKVKRKYVREKYAPLIDDLVK
ncbi:MAG: long-chain fatty acid--CoA ligase [Fimbriimonadaceae bacterium]|nr:long-chain fatty acid--CoA ligase [Fimbriimonadaceae bacterium]QYK56322.1 MAG: long-chain fatty acid--CoA ligase [Fimbriimonadaceae bacterium]